MFKIPLMFKLAFTFKLPFIVVSIFDLPIETDVAFVPPSVSAVAESIAEQLIEKLAMFKALPAVGFQYVPQVALAPDPPLFNTYPEVP